MCVHVYVCVRHHKWIICSKYHFTCTMYIYTVYTSTYMYTHYFFSPTPLLPLKFISLPFLALSLSLSLLSPSPLSLSLSLSLSVRYSPILERKLGQLHPILPNTSPQLCLQRQDQGHLQVEQTRLISGFVQQKHCVRRSCWSPLTLFRVLARLRTYSSGKRRQGGRKGRRRKTIQRPHRRLRQDLQVGRFRRALQGVHDLVHRNHRLPRLLLWFLRQPQAHPSRGERGHCCVVCAGLRRHNHFRSHFVSD